MTKFEEIIQDAPKFFSMERGELVTYAYGMFAAGTKANAENAKLRELVDYMTPIAWYAASERERDRMRELGIEVE